MFYRYYIAFFTISVGVCVCLNNTSSSMKLQASHRAAEINHGLLGTETEDLTVNSVAGEKLNSSSDERADQEHKKPLSEDKLKPQIERIRPAVIQKPMKFHKHSPFKKYTTQSDKKSSKDKDEIFMEPRMKISKRNDVILDNDLTLNPHTKFIKDINSLSEIPNVNKYTYDQVPQASQIVVPPDAEILIVKKRPSEVVVTTPPQANSNIYKTGVTHYVYNTPIMNNLNDNMVGSSSVLFSTKRPLNMMAQEVNEVTHPYKFVTPLIEDVLRTKYKKPHFLPFNTNMQQPVNHIGLPSSHVIVKTKRFVPQTPKLKDLPFWERFILTFFRLTK